MLKQKTDQKDDPRFSVDMKGYASFSAILDTIKDDGEATELFARPAKDNDPVHSYGVILFYRDKTSIRYFACQRRTTIEFAEIIKCGYRKDRLYYYFSNMTEKERILLTTQSFEKLWNDLLLFEAGLFNETKMKVAAKHDTYKPYLPDLMKCTVSNAKKPPFEFPKGRANVLQDKTFLASALRELKEEGGISLGPTVNMRDDISVVDVHKGTDGIKYQTTYFLIESSELFEPEKTYLNTGNLITPSCISKDMFRGVWIEVPVNTPPVKFSTPLPERLEALLFRIHMKLLRH
jgi:hypothetical protein